MSSTGEDTQGLLRAQGTEGGGAGTGVSAALSDGADDVSTVSAIDGLSSAQARLQRQEYGKNCIPAPTALPPWLCCLIPCLKQSKARKYFDICVPDAANVRRNGRWLTLDAKGVVPGDYLRLQAGDRAAADLRVTEVSALLCYAMICYTT
jgi:hypothetical protein